MIPAGSQTMPDARNVKLIWDHIFYKAGLIIILQGYINKVAQSNNIESRVKNVNSIPSPQLSSFGIFFMLLSSGMHMKSESESCSVVSDSLWTHGLYWSG